MHPDLVTLWVTLKARWESPRGRTEAGYATETVLVTAVLVVAALTVIGIIIAKVTAKANGINL